MNVYHFTNTRRHGPFYIIRVYWEASAGPCGYSSPSFHGLGHAHVLVQYLVHTLDIIYARRPQHPTHAVSVMWSAGILDYTRTYSKAQICNPVGL